MGDLIEITTKAREPARLYKITSSGFSFEIKTHDSAFIGLGNNPEEMCLYSIGFEQDGNLWINGVNGRQTSDSGTHLFVPNVFIRFWVSWDGGRLCVGQGHETELISYPYLQRGLKYVTFGTKNIQHPAVWRFHLRPKCLTNIERSIPEKVKGGKLKWIEVDDSLPDGAVVGGFEKECLYLIRAAHSGSLTPGKFVPSEGLAFVPWGGNANEKSEFEVLCGYDFIWKPTSSDNIPVDAFVAGYSEVHNETLYIGRVRHQGNIIPGKVQPSHRVCYIPFDTREISFPNYEILCIPGLDPHAAAEYLNTNIEFRRSRTNSDNSYDSD